MFEALSLRLAWLGVGPDRYIGAFCDQLRSMRMNSTRLTFVESVIRAQLQKSR